MFNHAIAGDFRALWIMGENPVISDPNQHHVIEALKSLEFFVVQDIFLTETAQYAHVVLPACAFLEKQGTISNTERRVQLMNKVLSPPGKAKDDWWIIMEVAKRMGTNWDYKKPKDIFAEIRKVTPSYAGITYDRIKKELLQWPCPTEDHPGTQFLHKDKFARGLGVLTPVEYFHTGTMSRNSKVLHENVPEGFIELNPNDAQNYNIQNEEVVSVSSRRGSIRIKAKVTERTKPNVVFFPWHFFEAAANVLTIDALDPVCKIPEYKVCSCKIEKVYP
jgi:predicted molibdopterin-dependent oxidoreductase YjgC